MFTRVIICSVCILATSATSHLARADGDAGADARALAFEAGASEPLADADAGDTSDGDVDESVLPTEDGSDVGGDATSPDGGDSVIADGSPASDALVADASDASSAPASVPDLDLPGESCSVANSAPPSIATIAGLSVALVAMLSRRRNRRS
ncbi:MAG: hypothetical protein ABTD50_07910 [Polyangiaceae bacterium]|jgi:hypothetical protein